MIRRVTVRGIVLLDGKLLCVKLKPYKGHLKRDNSYWCLPGGGLNEGEALIAGVEREMVEETGVKPSVGNLLYVQQFTHSGKEYLEFFFHITNATDYVNIDLSQTTHGMEEIESIDFVDPQVTHILPEFLQSEVLLERVSNDGPVRVMSRL